MPDDETPNLSIAETTLRNLLAITAAGRAGSIARAHGWPPPQPGQVSAMTSLITRVMTEIVTGMRHSLAAVPHAEELDAVVEGIVLGVLEKVMGLPSPDVVH